MQPASGKEEELDDRDVGRQPARAERIGIGEIGITAEQAVDDRRDEATLDQALRFRLFQRQRREQCQLDVRIRNCACIERVDDMVGLAEAERQADHEVGADIADDVLREHIGVGEQLWHHPRAPRPHGKTAPLGIGRYRRLPIAHLRGGFVCDEPATSTDFMGVSSAAVCLRDLGPLNR